MLQHERDCWRRGDRRVAGVDEAGRGPLAGPVVAAAVVIERDVLERESEGLLADVNDSKKLTASKREQVFAILEADASVHIGVGEVSPDDIDRINILQATHLAMARALGALPMLPQHALIDGRPVPGLPVPSTAIVGGDACSILIAAASIVAKVVRDRKMVAYDAEYPVYGFARHKGYGSQKHIQALFEHGPCPIHRRSFRPVREAQDIRER